MPRNRQGTTDIHVAHCVGFYFPQTVGGTEVYVHDLTTELSRDSISSSIVAATSRAFERYDWEGIPVLRYPNNWADVRERSPDSPGADLSKFQELILELDPDIFHLHSWTTGAGLRHLAQVTQLGISCVVTMHVPSALCLRGTMLLKGERPCDGRIDEKRCGQCWAMSHGLPEPLAFGLVQLPRLAASRSRLANVSRRMATVLSVRSLVKGQADDLQMMASLSQRIVAPSQWVYSALAANAVPSQKLIVSRQAVAPSLVDQGSRKRQKTSGSEIRIGFVGRLEHYKGVHILLEAMARIPAGIPIRLLVVGSGTDLAYLGKLEAMANRDKRIEFLGAMPHDRLSEFLEQIDVLAVPSNYMETGPLVVLEAHAFGIPVMGANIGGIAERIRDGVDGWLLPFDDSQAWAAAMQDAALNRDKVARFVGNILPSRTMADVASDMASLYREVLEAKVKSASGAAKISGAASASDAS
jgi:glycosyltransferase involved in cell wall biosynthesis